MRFGEFPSLVHLNCNSDVDLLEGVNRIINHLAELVQAGDSVWFQEFLGGGGVWGVGGFHGLCGVRGLLGLLDIVSCVISAGIDQ